MSPERAFLVAVAVKGSTYRWSAEASIDELTQLADTAGAEVVGKLIQQLPTPSKTHYLGKGKLDELTSLRDSTNYDTQSYITYLRNYRSGQNANLAAWDLGLGLVSAASCGVSGTELQYWIDGVKAEINELDALVENFRGRSDVRSVERVCVVLKPIKTHTQNGGMRI